MRILHVLRAPVGGLFRHVVDLAAGQAEFGHQVGLIADSGTASAISERALAQLAPQLALGICRFPIARQPGPTDFLSVWRVARRIHETGAEIVHGHGAKGGALSRLAPAARQIVRVYTPHGGSLHDEVGGWIGIQMERALKRLGHLYLFESAFSHDVYLRKVGKPVGLLRVVHNGLRPDEFKPVALSADAADIVFLGEMRRLKGVDVLIDALAKLSRARRGLRAVLIGDGPDAASFQDQARALGMQDLITFRGPMPAREALSLGRIVAMPSRAESLPYVVLEAAAAAKPLIATRVGGIPEIFGPYSDHLVPPGDVDALAEAIAKMAEAGDGDAKLAAAIQGRVKELFSAETMIEKVLESYDQARSRFGAQPAVALALRPRNG
jgi:glycosyltransferase involved in cell wall biosynthesis